MNFERVGIPLYVLVNANMNVKLFLAPDRFTQISHSHASNRRTHVKDFEKIPGIIAVNPMS